MSETDASMLWCKGLSVVCTEYNQLEMEISNSENSATDEAMVAEQCTYLEPSERPKQNRCSHAILAQLMQYNFENVLPSCML